MIFGSFWILNFSTLRNFKIFGSQVQSMIINRCISEKKKDCLKILVGLIMTTKNFAKCIIFYSNYVQRIVTKLNLEFIASILVLFKATGITPEIMSCTQKRKQIQQKTHKIKQNKIKTSGNRILIFNLLYIKLACK